MWRSLIILVRSFWWHGGRPLMRFQVGLPYLRAKAQDYYEGLGGAADADILDDGVRHVQALTEEVLCDIVKRLSR